MLLELLMEKLGTGLQDTKNELDGLPLCEPQPLAEYQDGTDGFLWSSRACGSKKWYQNGTLVNGAKD